ARHLQRAEPAPGRTPALQRRAFGHRLPCAKGRRPERALRRIAARCVAAGKVGATETVRGPGRRPGARDRLDPARRGRASPRRCADRAGNLTQDRRAQLQPDRARDRGHGTDRPGGRRQPDRAARRVRGFREARGLPGATRMSESLLPDDVIALARIVIERNAAEGRRVAVAESCTGGLVAAALTEIPGSSAVLDCGFVTYSNEAKQNMLGVAEDIIDAFGAVSVACGYAMAQGALARSQADVAVAISGIAGPDGGSVTKPVGTVVFARAVRGSDEPEAESRVFDEKDRAGVRRQATLCALELLLP